MDARDVRRSGRAARRLLGQNFLTDEGLATKIVVASGVDQDDLVVEIGAGSGVLTAALAERAGAVMAFEVDSALCHMTARRLAPRGNVRLLPADAMSHPLPRVPFRVVCNPPFSRTAAILRRLLDGPLSPLTRLDLIVQWQVARARVVGANQAPFDTLGVLWSPWWRFTRGIRVPRRCFQPAPRVDAAVLAIRRRVPPLLDPAAWPSYSSYVRMGFSGHILRRSFEGSLGKRRLARACQETCLSPHAEPRSLSPEQWTKLYLALG